MSGWSLNTLQRIGFRLPAAMAGLLTVLILSVVIAAQALTDMRDGLEQVATDDLTSVRLANQLAQDSQSILGHSPRLALATDDVSLLGNKAFIFDQLRQMEETITAMEQQGLAPDRITEFRARHADMRTRLEETITAVSNRNSTLSSVARRQADLLNLSRRIAAFHDTLDQDVSRSAHDPVLDWLASSGQLLTETSILLGSHSVGGAASADTALRATVQQVEEDYAQLPPAVKNDLLPLHTALLSLCCQTDTVMALYRKIQASQLAVLSTVRSSKQAADNLVLTALSVVSDVERGVQNTRWSVTRQWQRALALLVIGGILSTLTALLVFGYIQKSVVHRLNILRDAVRNAERGDPFPAAPDDVIDEIDDIRRALGGFVAALAGRESALRQSEEQLRHLIENAPFPLLVTDEADGRILFTNDRARDILLFGPNGVSPAHSTIYEHITDPAEQERVRSTLRGSPHIQGWELRLNGAGEPFWAVLSASPVTYRGQAGLLFTVHDIDRLKAAEERLSVLVRTLERSNGDLEQFAYAASHDLREPLRMVSGYMALLGRRLEPHFDEECHEYLRLVQDGVSRMDRLIRDLLDLSRVGRAAEKTTVDLNRVVATVVETLSDRIEAESTDLRLPEALPTLWGVESELHRLFQNLLSNALKYRALDRPLSIRITCVPAETAATGFLSAGLPSAHPDSDRRLWHFTIADTGRGIAPEHQDRVFLMFQRLQDRSDSDGTGIGLTLCRKIVEHHGGTLWLESRVGEGSKFHFTLPGTRISK